MELEAPRDNGGFKPSMVSREFPDLGDVYLLTQDGVPSQKINLNRLSNSQYWESKSREIGAVVLIATFFLIFTLLVETSMLEQAWTFVLQLIGTAL